MILRPKQQRLLLTLLVLAAGSSSAWVMLPTVGGSRRLFLASSLPMSTTDSSSPPPSDDSSSSEPTSSSSTDSSSSAAAARTSFDDAGTSLMDQEDNQRMVEMGDFDDNPAYQDDSMEKVRAAIRERTSKLGMEKSQISADYIKAREKAALQSGSARAADEQAAGGAMFGGLDLSKISVDGRNAIGANSATSQWDESMPTMFFDPQDEMTEEEQREADPIMTKTWIDQALNELNNAKWPAFGAAGREVVVMVAAAAFTAVLIIGSDTLLRSLYTNVGFIPSPDELANYGSQFDGLDLPEGWMDNMSETDVAAFADQVNSALPTTTSGVGSSLPDL